MDGQSYPCCLVLVNGPSMSQISHLKLDLLALIPLSQGLLDDLQLVSSELQVVPNQQPKGDYLKFDSEGISLWDQALGRMHLDFVHDSVNYTRSGNRGKSELIAKALGLAKGPQRIFDATIGLAQDAWFLSQLGATVEGCERSPVVFLLLSDALRRVGPSGFKIHYADSKNILSKHSSDYTAVYLDPMFPEKTKSALPRKEMQIFRKWVGADMDSVELLQLALKSGASRVVVKRPLKSAELKSGVVHSFVGSTVRYDLYSPDKETK